MKKLFTLMLMSICMVLTANAQDKHTYGVCGWGGDWNNDIAMTESPEGTWTAEITGVAAGTYSFKVRADGAWDYAYPEKDYVYEVKANNSTVTIVFTESTKEIVVSQTSDEAPVEIEHTYGVCGWEDDSHQRGVVNNEGRPLIKPPLAMCSTETLCNYLLFY